MKKLYVCYILSILLLSGCGNATKKVLRLTSSAYLSMPSKGPYEVIAGAREGCATAHASRGNDLYKSGFKYEQQPDLMRNEVYKFNWHRGYNYCFQRINRDTHSNIDSYFGQTFALSMKSADWTTYYGGTVYDFKPFVSSPTTWYYQANSTGTLNIIGKDAPIAGIADFVGSKKCHSFC